MRLRDAMSASLTHLLLLIAFAGVSTRPQTDSIDSPFRTRTAGEAVATIAAGCARCDWSVQGREAALLEIAVDGRYSQHLALTRGDAVSDYRVMLGPIGPGAHHVTIARDRRRSAAGAGAVTFGTIDVKIFDEQSAEYPWLSRAPILRARPGTVERFSDLPLVLYAEQHVNGESGSRYALQYTTIFSNEDGGTPTDRLMATWGRTSDIEFIYGLTEASAGAPAREEIQAADHKWIPFAGAREGTHPVLWVATENNMVADRGPDEAIRFAPAPELVSLDRTSREAVMDKHPWTYAVTSAEMAREHRIDPAAAPGSGRIPDPRRFATIEACGTVQDATFAFDIGVQDSSGAIAWYPTDVDPRFRLARSGCFRGGAPLPGGATPTQIAGLRVRAYPRAASRGEAPPAPDRAALRLQNVTQIFMLDEQFLPVRAPVSWTGTLQVPANGTPISVPLVSRATRSLSALQLPTAEPARRMPASARATRAPRQSRIN